MHDPNIAKTVAVRADCVQFGLSSDEQADTWVSVCLPTHVDLAFDVSRMQPPLTPCNDNIDKTLNDLIDSWLEHKYNGRRRASGHVSHCQPHGDNAQTDTHAHTFSAGGAGCKADAESANLSRHCKQLKISHSKTGMKSINDVQFYFPHCKSNK